MPDPVGIEGVRVIELSTRSDPRGEFMEVFRQDWLPLAGPMIQSNLSRSRSGVLRGMHFHRRQADYWCILGGRALVALYDLRAGSPTQGEAASIEVDAAEGHRGIYVPPGVAHGFFAHSDMELQYLVDRYFDGNDEFGFTWDDPALPIRWPVAEPILSDRDAKAPSLSEVLTDPPRWVDLPPVEA